MRTCPPPTPAAVLSAVLSATRVDLDALLSRSRHPEIVRARGLAVAAARACTYMSFPEIARMLGQSHHSGAVEASRRFEARATADELDLLSQIVNALGGARASMTAAPDGPVRVPPRRLPVRPRSPEPQPRPHRQCPAAEDIISATTAVTGISRFHLRGAGGFPLVHRSRGIAAASAAAWGMGTFAIAAMLNLPEPEAARRILSAFNTHPRDRKLDLDCARVITRASELARERGGAQ